VRPEVQFLITGDTDLVPAIRTARQAGVHVVVVAPPARGRTADTMRNAANNYLHVYRRHVRDALLPEVVLSPVNNYLLTPPDGWVYPAD
jgi:uncharacterized LabA/DUF88 family protein